MNESMKGVEQEIAHLEKQLAEKKAELSLEGKEQMITEREIIHQEVGKRIQEHAPEYQPIQSVPSVPSPSSAPEGQIQELINLVFEKDLKTAISAAQKLDNPAILDAFHDVLTSQLYQVLIERGKISN